MNIVEIERVFTPSSPAELTYIGRPDPEKQIKRALKNKGMQIVVYGNTGSGKTTLLYNLLSELNIKSITTRCTRGNSIKDILYDAFCQLGNYYVSEKSAGSSITKESGFNFGFDKLSFFSSQSLEKNESEISKRIVEIQKNPNLLARLFGSINYLWVIEDFHKLDAEPKRSLSQIMKVFMDVSAQFPLAKIIAIGAVDSARQVVHYDKEMENRVSEVQVPLMSPTQLDHLINLGEVHLNILFEPEVKEKIVAYSSGLASVTHQLCSLACENMDIDRTQIKKKTVKSNHLEYAIGEYVNEKSDSLKSIYEQSIKIKTKRKHEAPQTILEAILRVDKDAVTLHEVAQELSKIIDGYKSTNLRKYLMELTAPDRGEILRHNKNADSFSFSTPFLRGYCYIHLIKYPVQKKSTMHKEHQNAELLKNYLNDEFIRFSKQFNEGEFDDDF